MWVVYKKIKPSKFEPDVETPFACFDYSIHAEDFIEKCLPPESKYKFTIKFLSVVSAINSG